jgi:hypothetical protein
MKIAEKSIFLCGKAIFFLCRKVILNRGIAKEPDIEMCLRKNVLITTSVGFRTNEALY